MNEKLANAIQHCLTPDLATPKYRGEHRLSGHCYVASETYYHLAGGKENGLIPKQMNHRGVSHWFIFDARQQEIIDLTAAQFGYDSEPTFFEYMNATGRGFLTAEPSRRSWILIERVWNLYGDVLDEYYRHISHLPGRIVRPRWRG